ncbi:MAG: EAL domain-containing protein [Thermomonas sp.]|uniref:putative bifunctional diguanylate cyclase/phosphodiesterase n=1 Tax=Thermomonas sp. TaxID=1971895 RepID=UPI0039E6FD19
MPARRLARVGLSAPALPASASVPDINSSYVLVMLVALLVLALAWLAIATHRRREREQREHMEALRRREHHLHLALWASGELYWQYDLEKHELERTLVAPGSSDELTVLVDLDKDHEIHPDDMPLVIERLRDYVRGKTSIFLSEHRIRDNEGEWLWMRARGRAVMRSAEGRVVRMAGTARNVTNIRAKERERRIAGEVMRNMAEGVVVVDADFRFVAVNPAFTRISGYEEADVIGKDASLLNSDRHSPEFYAQSRGQIEANEHWACEMWQRRKDGHEFLCAMQANALLEPGTGRRLYVLVAADITERRRIEHELRYLANYDTLTSLPNRTLLSERLSRAIVRARRQNARMALLFLDLDRFKDVNDSLGHAIGDRILRAAAQRLLDVVGPSHTIARLGGDEFTVILEDIADYSEAEDCAQRIIDAFDAPLELDNRHEIPITPSIGISLFPEHAQVPTDMLKHADTAMYQAKAAGRRTYLRYADTMDGDIRRRASLVASLRKVVERGELHLVYQPQLALREGRICAVEALLRWNSPEHGEVSPASFIPLAEESGLIVSIGEWVLQQACRTLAQWRRDGLRELVVSVNVSAVQLLHSDLLGTVRKALDENGLPPSALELELTESVLMANAELATARLQAFRELGVSIAMDDFGTGYSSLAYLRKLPINTLKIDKAFIDDVDSAGDSDDAAITATIVAMAHSLELKVIAEGVESAEQLAFLRQHHCDTVQGYWLARPLDDAACLGFIRGWQADPVAAAARLDPTSTPA